ncbi:MAG: MFS transporter [Prevotellaceae bacterium]|jgi:DHA3 family macrolide efflux protein-like MFS transporter|nr:MFS transporter [Prevotellaceae bacterium]
MTWKKTFSIIWTGQFLSSISSNTAGYAVIFYLSLKTGSAAVMAYSFLAGLLPQLVIGLFSGAYVDRWNRKLTMIFSDSFIAICTAVLCFMFYFGKIEIWQIYILLACRSVGSAFHTPAMQASVPLLAPESELMRVSGVNQIIHSVSSIASPILAAFLITVLPMAIVLSFDIFGAAAACNSLFFVKIPNPQRNDIALNAPAETIFEQIKIGFGAIFQNKGVRWLFICEMAAMFFIIPISALFPLITTKYFGKAEYEMGIVEIAWGVGMLLGGAALSLKLFNNANRVKMIAFSCFIVGITFFFSGLLKQNMFVVFAVLTGVSGIAVAFWSSAFTVIFQTNIAPEKLGRAFSIYDSLSMMPALIALVISGYLEKSIGLPFLLIIAGASTIVVSAFVLGKKEARLLGVSCCKI